MTSGDYLRFLKEEIHSAVFATVGEDGLPYTCVIDIVRFDSDSVYFITAKGKAIFERLAAQPFVSVTGLIGKDTLSSKSITVRGKVMDMGAELLSEIFHENSYLSEQYPNEETRCLLTVFRIFEGEGEFLDLSAKPIFREWFTFNGGQLPAKGYFVTKECMGCGLCSSFCPQLCIDVGTVPAVIRQENCIHCGNCAEICPVKAIIRNY